jgi:hypothetical protein
MMAFNVLKKGNSLISVAVFLGTVSAATAVLAADAAKDHAALIKALAQIKISLIDGLRQSTKSPEAPISAKFEFDDKGKLSLSIYTVEKGLATDAEGNILKEFSGSPEAQWAPEVEVFKDIPRVARASQQLTLMSLSPFSLADIAAKAQKQHPGTVFSINPAVRNHKPVFVVLEADKGKAVELVFGLLDGKLTGTQK